MTIESLKLIFDRDLDKLKTELDAYSDENQLWLMDDGINNCAGNLVLHLCGNIQHFVGAILGKTGYIRRRDDEFNLKGVSIDELRKQIQTTKRVVQETLSGLDPEQLSESYPIKVFGDKEMSTNFFLIHLVTHLNYHLGQINYHRRILAK